MRVLVTGGAGFIGSHTTKSLAERGIEPIVLDNVSTGHRWAVQWGPLVEGDLSDAGLIREVLVKHEIEGVLHFAASAYVGESMENPRKYFRNNVANSLNLLEAVLDTGVKCVVFSSSCTTYGVPRTMPIDEDHLQHPVNPYGDTKLFVERALAWYGHAYGLRWMALRYFNAAGADPDGQIGEDHDPETHLIPIVLQVAAGMRPVAPIYGTDYPTPDGSAVRDYIHVTDLADAHVLALGHLMDGGDCAALNLGTGRGYSVREVVRTVQEVTGRIVPVVESPRRAGDPPELVADPSRARSTLGWSPRYSDLPFIVRSAWQWQVKEHDSERQSA